MYGIFDAVDRISNEKDREGIRWHIINLEAQLRLVVDERDFLRGQIANALRSMKFDLHPELP